MLSFIVSGMIFLAFDDSVTRIRVLPAERVASLQRALESTLFTALPTPLYQGDSHWGQTTKTPNGLKWKKGTPQLQYADKNHGTWRKYLVTLDQPPQDHLRLQVSNVQTAGNNTLIFQMSIEADIHFEITQQNWNSGIKLFAGSVRGRATMKAIIQCESKLVIEPGNSLIPVIKYRLRVIQIQPSYENLVFTHVPGLGGSAANAVGNWTMDAVQQMKPSMEKKLIEKLSQRLVKAADTKEIQLSLDGIERRK